MIACDPAARDDELYVAIPEALRVPLPRVVDPSRKLTEPVGMVELPEGPVTVAVNVTDCPLEAGFTDEATPVVDATLATGLTTCVSIGDVAPLKFESPP